MCFSLFLSFIFYTFSRIAHNLADGEIPVEQVRYELADLIVASLRTSPEHKALICNWSAMMSALDSNSKLDDEDEDDDDLLSDSRLDAVKQRVLLRLIVCAAEMEVSALSGDGHANEDPDLVEIHKSTQAGPKKKTESSHEELTLALLGALPSLLVSYKSETPVLESLTGLPQYFRKFPGSFPLTVPTAVVDDPFSNFTCVLCLQYQVYSTCRAGRRTFSSSSINWRRLSSNRPTRPCSTIALLPSPHWPKGNMPELGMHSFA
jgi:hypothetical protein